VLLGTVPMVATGCLRTVECCDPSACVISAAGIPEAAFSVRLEKDRDWPKAVPNTLLGGDFLSLAQLAATGPGCHFSCSPPC